MCRSWLTPVGARTGSKRIKASSCRRVWHPCHTHAPQHNLLWFARLVQCLRSWCTSRGCSSLCCTNKVNGAVLARLVPSRGCSSLCCTNKVNGAFLRGWCTSRGCSSLCCTNKVNGAFLRGWCTFYSIGALETSAPPKKNPNRGEPPLGFSFICVFRYLLNKHLL